MVIVYILVLNIAVLFMFSIYLRLSIQLDCPILQNYFMVWVFACNIKFSWAIGSLAIYLPRELCLNSVQGWWLGYSSSDMGFISPRGGRTELSWASWVLYLVSDILLHNYIFSIFFYNSSHLSSHFLSASVACIGWNALVRGYSLHWCICALVRTNARTNCVQW